MDINSVCRDFEWRYINDQSANRTRLKPKEVEFEYLFTEDQDVHWRRQTMKVSLKMLKRYCYESCYETMVRYAILYKKEILSLSWFSFNFEVNFHHISEGPQALNYFKEHCLFFFSSATGDSRL